MPALLSLKGHPLCITAALMKNKQEGKHQGRFHKKLPFNVCGRKKKIKKSPHKFDCFHTELANLHLLPPPRCRQTVPVNATVVFSHCKSSLAAISAAPTPSIDKRRLSRGALRGIGTSPEQRTLSPPSICQAAGVRFLHVGRGWSENATSFLGVLRA